jgi:hypothetical protein
VPALLAGYAGVAPAAISRGRVAPDPLAAQPRLGGAQSLLGGAQPPAGPP